MRNLRQIEARLAKLEAAQHGGIHCYAVSGESDAERQANETRAMEHLAAQLGRPVHESELIVFVRRFTTGSAPSVPAGAN